MQKKLRSFFIPLLFILTALIAVGSGSESAGSPDAQAAVVSGQEKKLIPGGMTFGVKFFTDGVLVIGFSEDGEKTSSLSDSPAYAAGIRCGDVILRADGAQLTGAGSLTDAVDASGGKPIEFLCRRGGREFTVTVTPRASSDGKYHAGMWVRDGGAGIGTVTFIDPDTNIFGGLGHGICDGETGKPMPLGRGVVMGVTVSGLRRGSVGTPGEIRGYFEPEKLGAVTGNTDCGVFGIFSELPADAGSALPLASPKDVTEGPAVIRCALKDGKVREYGVELSSIDRDASGGRCFSVKVTDPALIALTGGIIQGMSGSPVIQNGKLVGAVTHVLINDPTSGYGIFIGNMLRSMPESLQ